MGQAGWDGRNAKTMAKSRPKNARKLTEPALIMTKFMDLLAVVYIFWSGRTVTNIKGNERFVRGNGYAI